MSPHAPACNDNDVLDIADGRLRAAQAKWSRLTPDDLSGIRDRHGLIAMVEKRYSLPHGVAVQDVDLWLKATLSG